MLGTSMTPWHPQLSVHHLPAGALEVMLCGLQTPSQRRKLRAKAGGRSRAGCLLRKLVLACADAQREEGALIDSTLLSPDSKAARWSPRNLGWA